MRGRIGFGWKSVQLGSAADMRRATRMEPGMHAWWTWWPNAVTFREADFTMCLCEAWPGFGVPGSV